MCSSCLNQVRQADQKPRVELFVSRRMNTIFWDEDSTGREALWQPRDSHNLMSLVVKKIDLASRDVVDSHHSRWTTVLASRRPSPVTTGEMIGIGGERLMVVVMAMLA